MNLDEKTVIAIISHFTLKDDESGEQFPGNIRKFLLRKIQKVVYIDHPFIQSQQTSSDFLSSQMRIYEGGLKTYQLTSPKIKLPTLILFIYQLLLTAFFITLKPTRYDLCIACDNLSLVAVFLFRKIGLIKKIVYYSVDYTPKRYKNPFLNSLYHYIDKLACRIADKNWVAVKNIMIAKVQNGLDLKKCGPFQIVPISFSNQGIVLNSIKKINRFNLVFVGFLFEKQGLQLVIKVLPRLARKFPKIHLTIIGTGPIESQIKKSVKILNLNPYVTFTGYINDHQKILNLLTELGGIGLATYIPSLGDYTYNADPSKIKLYLLCGLPVITTKVPPIAGEIRSRKAGFVIDYSEQELMSALDFILRRNENYLALRKNALKMAETYETNSVLSKAFEQL